MKKDLDYKVIIDTGLIAIVRFESSKNLVSVAKALHDGGVRVLEFTMTTPNALDVLRESKKVLNDDTLIGAGTILDSETARSAILAGADFIVSPTFDRAVFHLCNRYSKICIPGVMTPTEIINAWQEGADLLKIFPIDIIGGPRYIKALKAPFPNIAMIPVGGVSLENIPLYFEAGASAVAVGSNLVNNDLVKENEFDKLVELASRYVKTISLVKSKTP